MPYARRDKTTVQVSALAADNLLVAAVQALAQ